MSEDGKSASGAGINPPSGGYGEAWADIYDDLYDDRDDTSTVVEFVMKIADPPTVLELGVGTGRLALPLAAAGLDVVGIDNSAAMLARLQAKPGAERVTTHLGDMTAPPVSGPFGCVLIAFSTLYLLADQDEQGRCLRAAADRLAPGGSLVIEGFIPDPTRWHNGHSLTVERWDSDRATFSVGRIDPAAQTIETLRITHPADGTPAVPNRLRYVLPAELDLLAELAGLRLAGRYAGFDASPLAGGATSHVSVYSRP
jgi:SAM-dependent methyltransferase